MKHRPWTPPQSVEEALSLQGQLRKEIQDIKAELSTSIKTAPNHKEWQRQAALALNVKRNHLDRVNRYLEKHQPQTVHKATAARAVRRMLAEIERDIWNSTEVGAFWQALPVETRDAIKERWKQLARTVTSQAFGETSDSESEEGEAGMGNKRE